MVHICTPNSWTDNCNAKMEKYKPCNYETCYKTNFWWGIQLCKFYRCNFFANIQNMQIWVTICICKLCLKGGMAPRKKIQRPQPPSKFPQKLINWIPCHGQHLIRFPSNLERNWSHWIFFCGWYHFYLGKFWYFLGVYTNYFT